MGICPMHRGRLTRHGGDYLPDRKDDPMHPDPTTTLQLFHQRHHEDLLSADRLRLARSARRRTRRTGRLTRLDTLRRTTPTDRRADATRLRLRENW
jgi:hypothetical protein